MAILDQGPGAGASVQHRPERADDGLPRWRYRRGEAQLRPLHPEHRRNRRAGPRRFQDLGIPGGLALGLARPYAARARGPAFQHRSCGRAALSERRTRFPARVTDRGYISRNQRCMCRFIRSPDGIMFVFRLAMIHTEPAITSKTMSTPNASASTLLVLSGPVVMCRKKTRCTPIWAMARTARPRATPGPQSSDVLATQKEIAVRMTARASPTV